MSSSDENLLVEALKRATLDPVWFAQEILNLKANPGEHTLESNPQLSWEMDQWQKNLLNAVADVVRFKKGLPTVINHKGCNQITVRSMHGPGKTFGLAVLMHWFGFCFYGKIPCTAPKLKQLKTRLWPEFRKIRGRALPGYRGLMDVQSETVRWVEPDGTFSPDHTAIQETAVHAENLAGLHDRFMLFIVDEASGVDETLWPVIEGAISTGEIVILVTISNPTKITGTFAASHTRPAVMKNWFQMHISLDDTSRVSRQWVQNMEDKYGKDSPVVQVRCYGEFPEDDVNQLMSMGWLVDAMNREILPEGDGSIPRLRVTVDVADGGANYTVITVSREYQSVKYFVKQFQFNFPKGRGSVLAADEAERIFNEYGGNPDNGDDIVVDGLGVGAGTVATLFDRGLPVVRYVGGSASSDPKKWRNRRVQSYMVARDDLMNGRVAIADDFVAPDEVDDFLAQMCSIKSRPGTERVEDLMTKEQMAAKNITSPDRADSWAMSYATQQPMITGSILQSLVAASSEMQSYDAGISE